MSSYLMRGPTIKLMLTSSLLSFTLTAQVSSSLHQQLQQPPAEGRLANASLPQSMWLQGDNLEPATSDRSIGSNASQEANNDDQGQHGTDQGDQVPIYMQHMTTILVILHVSVFITGLVGNSLVCLSVYRNKSLQTVTNYYIVNLAVADFLVILICLPPTVYWDLKLTWNFGLVLCKLVLYLQVSKSVHFVCLNIRNIRRSHLDCYNEALYIHKDMKLCHAYADEICPDESRLLETNRVRPAKLIDQIRLIDLST